MIENAVSFLLGCIVTAVMIRYGLGLGTRIVQKTQNDLPVFGREKSIPVTQTHTSGIEDIELEEIYEDENDEK